MDLSKVLGSGGYGNKPWSFDKVITGSNDVRPNDLRPVHSVR